MKVSFLERAAHFLTKQRRHSYWLAAVACLALAVMTGTVYSLIRQGQASVYMEKTLACPVTVHVHGADCYDESGQLICGYADYVVHTHNDDCYDAGGQLVCQLGEAEEHIHDESCWETERVLVCPLEETGSHQHTDACYAHCPLSAMPDHQHTEACSVPGPCSLEEHVHTDACYEWVAEESLSVTSESASPEAMAGENALPAEDSGIPSFLESQPIQESQPEIQDPQMEIPDPQPEIPEPQPAQDPQPEIQEPQPKLVRKLICGKAEHTHSNQCQWLACGQEDGAMGHVHTDACYEERQVLSCGKNELHTHTPECYENGQLICGKLEVRSHFHDENCFRVHKLDEDEVTNLTPGGDPETPDVPETPGGHVHGPECYGPAPLICMEEEHAHTTDCIDEATKMIKCGKVEHIHGPGCYGPAPLICSFGETIPPFTPENPADPGTPGILPGQPGCGKEEHVHGGDCIDGSTLELICGKEQHVHTEDCWSQIPPENPENPENPEIPGDPENPETPGEEQPEAPAYLCGKEEHTHTDECYFLGLLTCGKEEHTHDETCLIPGGEDVEDNRPLYCGKEEHTHTADCWSQEGVLICGLEEHTHGESCRVEQPKEPETVELSDSFTYEGEAFQVVFKVDGQAVTVPEEDGGTPAIQAQAAADEGVVFQAKPLATDSQAYQSAYQFAEEDGASVLELQVLQLSATLNGEKLDLSKCGMVAEITPTEELVQYAESASAPMAAALSLEEEPLSPEEEQQPEQQITVAALRVAAEEDAQPELLSSATIEESAQKALTVPVSVSGTDGEVAVYAARSTTNLLTPVTVQYYAYLDTVKEEQTTGGTGNHLLMVDPLSGSEYVSQIKLDKIKDGPTYPNHSGLEEYPAKIVTESVLTEMYREAPSVYTSILDELNIFEKDSLDYDLTEIWVLNIPEGATEQQITALKQSKEKTDWTVYELSGGSYVSAAGDTFDDTTLKGGEVVRLVGAPIEDSATGNVTFYDYSVNGENKINGNINSAGNYGVSSLPNNRLTVNQYGGHENNKYSGGTPRRGLADRVNTADDTIQYKVEADPGFFNESKTQEGKRTITNLTLQFAKTGDTYVMTGVNGGKTSPYGGYDRFLWLLGKNGRDIWSNNFWPLDELGDDPGATGGTGWFNDNQAHNDFFGMQYKVGFNVPENYTGPLDYYFYGDDDLWVFVDGQLVADLGGLHDSVGTHVDLRTALGDKVAGDHTLHVFYMERGSYGSSCWMRFTLPGAIVLPPQQPDEGSLKVSKVLEGSDSDQPFEFLLMLDEQLKENYSYTIRDIVTNQIAKDENGKDKTGTVTGGENTFCLKGGEYILINGLPVTTTYTVEEIDAGGFIPVITKPVSGEVVKSEKLDDVTIVAGANNVTFTNRAAFELPETGGLGYLTYTLSGGLLIAATTLVLRKKRSRKEDA